MMLARRVGLSVPSPEDCGVNSVGIKTLTRLASSHREMRPYISGDGVYQGGQAQHMYLLSCGSAVVTR
jgi:hypothetical protein